MVDFWGQAEALCAELLQYGVVDLQALVFVLLVHEIYANYSGPVHAQHLPEVCQVLLSRECFHSIADNTYLESRICLVGFLYAFVNNLSESVPRSLTE